MLCLRERNASFLIFLGFLYLDRDLIELHAPAGFFHFLVDLFLIWIKAGSKLAHLLLDEDCIINEAAAPEDNGALQIRRPFALLEPLISVYRKADLVALFQCVDLMSGLCTVKINFVVFDIIKIVDRNRVRIPVIAVHGKDSALFVEQQRFGCFLGERFFASSNWPEHKKVLL